MSNDTVCEKNERSEKDIWDTCHNWNHQYVADGKNSNWSTYNSVIEKKTFCRLADKLIKRKVTVGVDNFYWAIRPTYFKFEKIVY